MKQPIFHEADFHPAQVHWDKFLLDPELPLAEQAEDLEEDMLWASFPNGVSLDVGWYPSSDPDGQFRVVLVQNSEDWVPFQERRCRSLAELQMIVREFIEIARQHLSIRRPLFVQGEIRGGMIVFDARTLDHVLPVEQQVDALKELLLEVWLPGDHRLRVGWHPAHDPSGEFVLTLDRREPEQELSEPGDSRSAQPTPGPIVAQRRCRTIPQLQAAVKDLSKLACKQENRTRFDSSDDRGC